MKNKKYIDEDELVRICKKIHEAKNIEIKCLSCRFIRTCNKLFGLYKPKDMQKFKLTLNIKKFNKLLNEKK